MNKTQTFECEICKDAEFIVVNKPIYTEKENGISKEIYGPVAEPCKCRELKYYKRILEGSGISEVFQSKTIREYIPKNDKQKQSKAMAIEYINNFHIIRSQRNNSLGITGQPGSGKTHLTIAISNELLRRGIGVLYLQYREVMTQLKQVINDDEQYQMQMNRFKSAPLLLIDDLFKGAIRDGKVNESEMRIMFELINHRYLKQLPVLVSSEYNINKMIDFDDATGSRIAEMCKGRTIDLIGKELNHRMI
ncbi:hypothetical protein L323_14920 [Ruminiclostridium papyrosolvens C7]|uniref:AAA+ ATPase domain-containing protein n=2 Tax=Ruminiclostridium papyrosolvens TaxID=29362 RepID=U4QYU2_9FIRM|nr:hypothetical protein L323_14920 [Ruminiclostridium papyrosolvens C7]